MSRRPLVDEVIVMPRRSVLLASGIGLLAPPLTRGQPQSRTPRIGVLWVLPADDPIVAQYRSIFLKRLSELGYVEGKNMLIEERSAEGHGERLGELARELVTSRVDVIVAPTVATSHAARQATGVIPIVMVHAGDPVGAGLIASLAQPGANVTGTTNLSLGAKHVELIRELVPRAVRIAILVNPSNTGARSYVADAMEAGRSLKISIAVAEVNAADHSPFAHRSRGRSDRINYRTWNSSRYLRDGRRCRHSSRHWQPERFKESAKLLGSVQKIERRPFPR